MEINKHEGLNPLQQFRYELLQWCGKTEDAAKAYQFVIGTEQQQVATTQTAHGFCTSATVVCTFGALRPATRSELGRCQHLLMLNP